MQFFSVIVDASKFTSQYNRVKAYDCAMGSEEVAHAPCIEVTILYSGIPRLPRRLAAMCGRGLSIKKEGSKLQGWTCGSCYEESNNRRTRSTKHIYIYQLCFCIFSHGRVTKLWLKSRERS